MATPLSCSTSFIQFVGTPTQWYTIDLLTGNAVFYGYLNPQDYVNAIGYNPLDNFIYGYDVTVNQIVQVDANRNIVYLGLPTGLPANGYNAGCFDKNGYFYIMLNGAARFYTIDLRPGSSSYMRLVNPLNNYNPQSSNYGTVINNGTMNVSDWDCDDNGFLYGVQPNGVMQRINLANGNVISMTTSGPKPNASFGATSTDYNGYIYAIENNDGKIFRYTVNGTIATAEYFSTTYYASQNDGCMCRNAQLLIDFGDAPDLGSGNGPGNYNTLFANNGPRHQILNELYLGTQVTPESDAYQNADATGDDLVEGIQDDGIAVPLPPISISATSYAVDVTVTNNTGQDAYVYGWVDFNANGLFEPDEIAEIVTVPSMMGTQIFTMEFIVPEDTILEEGMTFARFRITTDDMLTGDDGTGQDMASVGAATDGEVEDYIVSIAPIADLEIVKTADSDSVFPGDTLTYTLTIINNGPDAAQAPVLVDNIFVGIDNVEYSLDGGMFWDTWDGSITLFDFDAGDTIEVQISGVVDINASGVFLNTASISSVTIDPNTENNTDQISTTVLENANISVVKSASPETVYPGDFITYTILVSNAGPSDAENVELADIIPEDIESAVFSMDNGATWSSWITPLSIGTLVSGDAVPILISGTVQVATTSTSIVNTATVTSDTPDSDLSDNTSTTETPVSQEPTPVVLADLEVVKTCNPTTVVAGEMLTYTIVITNNGPSNAVGVSLVDSISATVSNPEFSLDDGTTWLPWIGVYPIQNPLTGMVSVGESITVLIRGIVSPTATRRIKNTATATSATQDPDLTNNTSTISTPTTAVADMEIVKTVLQNPVDAGMTLAYNITITNNGPSQAQNVVITDDIPLGLTNVEYSIDAGITWLPWTGGYDVGTVAAGAVIAVIAQGLVMQGVTGIVSNTAVVSSSTLDPDTDNNTSTAPTTVNLSADVSIIKTSSTTTATAGELLVYSLEINNGGPSDASDVLVYDNIAPYISNPMYSLDNSTWQPWVSPYAVGLLACGDSVTIFIEGFVNSDMLGAVRNTAIVTSSTPDPDKTNNQSTVRLPVSTFAFLNITKTADANPVMAGDNLTYALTISNNGPSDALNIVVTDDIPAEVLDPEFSVDNGVTWQAWAGTCTVATLPANESMEILIQGNVPNYATGIIINIASVVSDTPDPDISDNTAVQITPIITQADLSITKTTAQTTVSVGDTMLFTLVIENNGPDDAQNVVIADIIPQCINNAEFSVDNGVTWQPWGGFYALATLPSDAFITILIQGVVNNYAAGTIVNTAFVSSTTLDPDMSNNYSFSISKTPCPCPPPPKPITRDDVLNQIVSSIAMEELALSHILNAEGEKIQYILGTLPGVSGPSPDASVHDVLRVNAAATEMVRTINDLQIVLSNKLTSALESYTKLV